jgi:hypothetical protein
LTIADGARPLQCRFLADVERLKLDLDPHSGEEVQALVIKLFASTPAQVARAREVVK